MTLSLQLLGNNLQIPCWYVFRVHTIYKYPKLTVTPDGIMNLVNNVKICTLAGDDGVSSKLVKFTENVNSIILSSLFSLSLTLDLTSSD